ncbi:MAG: division/cell wall cluster transcriptional repressor MraZ [Pseudomonadota bacterium]
MNSSVQSDKDFYSEAQEDLGFNVFSESSMLSFDGEGRIILPAKLLEYSGITDRASFAGFGSTFLIWEPATLEQKKAESRRRVQERGLSVRLAKPNGEGS